MTLTRPRWARILLAAVRLAAIYAAGVVILLLPLMAWWSRRGELSPDDQPWLKVPVAGLVCFAFGFVALAAVKRLGFVVLWGLLLWQWITTVDTPMVFLDMPFLAWTALGVPLYVLSAVGLSSETAGFRRWRIEFVTTLLIWAIIAAVAFLFAQPVGQFMRIEDPVRAVYYARTAQGYAYAAWPFVIVARELVRVGGALWRSRKEASTA